MTTLVSGESSIPLALEDHFARNLIGGQWKFAAAPYEYEIRSPLDSRILAVVPLSSRFDVTDAVEAARTVLLGKWSDREVRARFLHRLIERLALNEDEIARLQSAETGLSPDDSLTAVRLTLREARALLRCELMARAPQGGRGVSGHILSWGLPFTEVVSSVLPALVRGEAVVVKPSLRAPLSAALFGHLAGEAGFHPGVVNIVQGTGGDVGAELVSRRDLAGLYVRGSERTLAQAERAHPRTSVPLRTVRAGGNVAVVGPGGAEHLDSIVEVVTAMVRMNSAGGPFNLPLLAVHADEAEMVTGRVFEALLATVAAPLPTEPLRAAARVGVSAVVGAGAQVRLGGTALPDDIQHRMGWLLPPTVLSLGALTSPAARAFRAAPPLGPVLGIVTFEELTSLEGWFDGRRYADGVAQIWGAQGSAPQLPHNLVVTRDPDADYTEGMRIPPSWLGCAL